MIDDCLSNDESRKLEPANKRGMTPVEQNNTC